MEKLLRCTYTLPENTQMFTLITKGMFNIYIALFGFICFSFCREAVKAYKACNKCPPFNLQIQPPVASSDRLPHNR